MRQREENAKTTALVFRSGKIVVTGAKSEELAMCAAKRYAKMIRKIINRKVDIGDFKIHNVVATADFGMEIGLERLSLEHSTFSSYEPELFPGLVYRMISPKCVMLIFASGKVVFTGAKTMADVLEARDCIEPVLRKH
jgi:transcription initiation factor TFIID TATA-box-binding protein